MSRIRLSRRNRRLRNVIWRPLWTSRWWRTSWSSSKILRWLKKTKSYRLRDWDSNSSTFPVSRWLKTCSVRKKIQKWRSHPLLFRVSIIIWQFFTFQRKRRRCFFLCTGDKNHSKQLLQAVFCLKLSRDSDSGVQIWLSFQVYWKMIWKGGFIEASTEEGDTEEIMNDAFSIGN